MGFYVLSNGEGSYITQNCGKYVQIRSFDKAKKFPDLKRAENILRSSISKSIRSNYTPEFHENLEQVNKSSVVKQNEICFRVIEDNNISDWQEKVKELLKMFENIEERLAELSSKLSDVDKEITDIQHYIEFGKFNCYQGWLCFKMLQTLLKQRRKYKDEIQVIQRIRECKISKDSIDVLSTTISDIKNKLYTPRKFPELFQRISND